MASVKMKNQRLGDFSKDILFGAIESRPRKIFFHSLSPQFFDGFKFIMSRAEQS